MASEGQACEPYMSFPTGQSAVRSRVTVCPGPFLLPRGLLPKKGRVQGSADRRSSLFVSTLPCLKSELSIPRKCPVKAYEPPFTQVVSCSAGREPVLLRRHRSTPSMWLRNLLSNGVLRPFQSALVLMHRGTSCALRTRIPSRRKKYIGAQEAFGSRKLHRHKSLFDKKIF